MRSRPIGIFAFTALVICSFTNRSHARPEQQAATPMVLAPAMRAWPCVQALPTEDVRAAGRRDVLVDAIRPRPGYSACEWRSPGGGGFRVAVATAEEFVDARVAGAAGYFETERMLLAMSGADRIAGLGLEALVSTGGPTIGLVRTAADVLSVICDDCTRDQVIALARHATTRLAAASAARATSPPVRAVAMLPMPCLQLVDEAAVKATVSGRFTVTATEAIAGDSSCMWWEDESQKPTRTFHIGFVDRRAFVENRIFPTGVQTAAGIYAAEVAGFAQVAVSDRIAGVGEQATAFPLGSSTMILVQRPDGLVRVMGDLPRPQLIALARRAAAAPAPTIGAHVGSPDMDVADEVGPMILEPAMRSWPCVQLLTVAEVRSLKRPEVLIDAVGIRPGFTSCEWRSTTSQLTGFLFAVAERDAFLAAGAASAAAFMADERRRLVPVFRPEPLQGLGDEAIVFLVVPTQPMVMVRRGEQLLTLNCFACSREQAVALARLAAAR